MGGIIKRKVRHKMRSTVTPIRLWDYCWEYTSSIYFLTASNHILLDGVTPHKKVMGCTPDISEYIDYTWYQWVWYYEPKSDHRQEIGRWLGPAHSCGQGLAYHILTEKGKVVTRSTVSNIVNETDEVKKLKSEFTRSMESYIGNNSKSTEDFCEDFNQEDPYCLIFDIDNDAVDDEDIEFIVTTTKLGANPMSKISSMIRRTPNLTTNTSDYMSVCRITERWYTARWSKGKEIPMDP